MTPYRVQPRLSMQELAGIIDYYRTHLSTWRIVHKDTLIREDGPVVQGIAFERLSDGTYRPTGHINVLVAPDDYWFLELSQNLNVKVRQINRRQHPEFRERVLDAIRHEFVPAVDQPLVAEDVLALYEEKAVPTSAEAYSLAPLNAYLGHVDRARYWCAQFPTLVEKAAAPWQDFDVKRLEFLKQLEQWIDLGIAKQRLDGVLDSERRKWKL